MLHCGNVGSKGASCKPFLRAGTIELGRYYSAISGPIRAIRTPADSCLAQSAVLLARRRGHPPSVRLGVAEAGFRQFRSRTGPGGAGARHRWRRGRPQDRPRRPARWATAGYQGREPRSDRPALRERALPVVRAWRRHGSGRRPPAAQMGHRRRLRRRLARAPAATCRSRLARGSALRARQPEPRKRGWSEREEVLSFRAWLAGNRACGYIAGSRTTKRAPSTLGGSWSTLATPMRFSAQMRPPCASMICLEIDRPRPEFCPKPWCGRSV
jgi:hypothetical protein